MGADNVHATKGERMYDTGSTTFMLICTMLVFLMTPGLAFFYGGLSRRKNVINTMLMCFGAIGLVGVLWIVAGWSLAYGGDGSNPFIGGLDQLLCLPVLGQVLQAAEGTASDGAVYPEIINIAFQMAFAMITAPIFMKSSIIPSLSAVARICSEPGLIISGEATLRFFSFTCLARDAARLRSW